MWVFQKVSFPVRNELPDKHSIDFTELLQIGRYKFLSEILSQLLQRPVLAHDFEFLEKLKRDTAKKATRLSFQLSRRQTRLSVIVSQFSSFSDHLDRISDQLLAAASFTTRSGPMIPPAGQLEGEASFGFWYAYFWHSWHFEFNFNFVRTSNHFNFVRTSKIRMFSRSSIFGLENGL